MPLVPNYRNALRGLTPEQLKKKLQALQATPPVADEVLDPAGERKAQILQRRLTLAKNPGIRKEVLGKDVSILREAAALGSEADPELSQRAAALKAKLSHSIENRPGSLSDRPAVNRAQAQPGTAVIPDNVVNVRNRANANNGGPVNRGTALPGTAVQPPNWNEIGPDDRPNPGPRGVEAVPARYQPAGSPRRRRRGGPKDGRPVV